MTYPEPAEGKPKILLAMSGGVDSSTAALLLARQGFDVVGCTMQLWDYRRNPAPAGEPRFGRCCSLDDVYDARRIAEQLGFPFYVLNLEKEFQSQVIVPFVETYLSGRTPVPCTGCNTFLKFDRLLVFANQVGIDRVATGHYARIERDQDGTLQLWKGAHAEKDQSYYLFELTQSQLARIEFPVGVYEKDEIRRIARENRLQTAAKPDSQEICFVPDGDYAGFIDRHAEELNGKLLPLLRDQKKSGPILFKDGTLLGSHQGVYRFTVGQRRGLGVAHSRPLYVLRLEAARNAVIVGYREDLFSRGLVACRLNWIRGMFPETPFEADVKIRARHEQAKASLRAVGKVGGEQDAPRVEVIFESPQSAVTPGQAAVFYQGDRVLGGGWIESRIT